MINRPQFALQSVFQAIAQGAMRLCEFAFVLRFDSSNTRAKGGTGLGLAIAREIVALHGGRIRVESELGRGRMQLPVRAAGAA